MSVAEPPPSRLMASSAPKEIMSRASSPRLSPPSTPDRRPSQQTASSSVSFRPKAQRGCRPTVMSESNWPAPAEKPSLSCPVDQRASLRNEQGPCLDQVARWIVGGLLPPGDSDAAVDLHAPVPARLRRRDGFVLGQGLRRGPGDRERSPRRHEALSPPGSLAQNGAARRRRPVCLRDAVGAGLRSGRRACEARWGDPRPGPDIRSPRAAARSRPRKGGRAFPSRGRPASCRGTAADAERRGRPAAAGLGRRAARLPTCQRRAQVGGALVLGAPPSAGRA
jgi:hypothetical protein